MLLYVAALLDGETSYLRRNEYESPSPLLYYVSNFLLDQNEKNKLFNSLYAAVAIVRAWHLTSNIYEKNRPKTSEKPLGNPEPFKNLSKTF